MQCSLPDDQELDWERPMGVTSSSSEESFQSDSNEPRTASQARFQALKRWFETPPKMEEIGPLHGVQRLF